MIGFDQGVVKVALAAAGIGEVVVAHLLPALLAQIGDGVGILARLHVQPGWHGEGAFFDHAVDGQKGIAVKRVGVETGERQRQSQLQIALPDIIVLGGQAEHQIGHNHRIQPAQFFQIGQRFFAAVFAAEPLADGGIESLHADGNARGAGVDAGLGFVHAEMAHAAFNGKFAIIGQRQIIGKQASDQARPSHSLVAAR